MPTYQYECDHCAHQFEVMQSMTEKRLTQCPKCQKDTLHRLIGSGAGVIFKGSGFYETDYKRKSCPASNTCPAAQSKPASKDGCGCCNTPD